MSFKEREFPIGQDLFAIENMANGNTLHSLGMYSVYVAEENPLFQVQAYKQPDEEPYHAFSWLSSVEDTRVAAELLDKAGEIEGLDANTGTFIVIDEEGVNEYDWFAEEAQGAKDVTEFDLTTAELLRVEAEKATIVWTKPHAISPGFRMGIITAEDIRSLWIDEFVAKTTNETVRNTITDGIGLIAVRLAQFRDLPLGEPLPLEPRA